jgi:sigma-B regulation protein RsbU (phosphoserine phosphatase)
MTAWSSVSLAVATMRKGVADFVEKPWDNTRLLEAVRNQVSEARRLRRAQNLETEAEEAQRRLLPRVLPQASGFGIGVAFAPAHSLSGDAYAIVPLPHDRLGVAIADVCGKGAPAALVMASAQARLEDLMTADLEPREVCARLDGALRGRLGPRRFVSLVCAVIDRRAGVVTYSNGGHPAPVLLRRDGNVVRLGAGGPVLGIAPSAEFTQEVVAIAPDERLVFFTDGIVEAEDLHGEEWGDSRLIDLLGTLWGGEAASVALGVLERARSFAEPDPLKDDATVLVVDPRSSQGGP